MTSLSPQAIGHGLDPLLRIPVELLENIFCLFSRLSDVFALAATCHQLRHVWTTSTNGIYRQVAPRCIPCEPYARAFLVDQGRPAKESPLLSVEDVRRLVRNSWMVEKSISEFERKIVCNVQTALWDVEKAYGAGARGHPKCLTRTERPRFIRSYYQIWSLMELNPAAWQSRLEAASLKQLILLCEMSNLTQSVGLEHERSDYPDPDSDPKRQHPASFRRSDKRRKLSRKIRKHMHHTYRRIHDKDFISPWEIPDFDGYLSFVVLWDHWQPRLENLVCRRQGEWPIPARSFDGPGVWDDSSDDDSLA